MTCLSKNPDLWGNKSVFQKRIFVLRALLNGAQAELNWGILAEKQAAVILYLKTIKNCTGCREKCAFIFRSREILVCQDS